jgi:hypothetical protein
MRREQSQQPYLTAPGTSAKDAPVNTGKEKQFSVGLLLAFATALVSTGCTEAAPKTALTEKQACILAMKALPPADGMYSAHFAKGIWHVSVIPNPLINNTPTTASAPFEVATVRDSNGSVEIVQKPNPHDIK